jgi:hypothetical protein
MIQQVGYRAAQHFLFSGCANNTGKERVEFGQQCATMELKYALLK